MFNSLSKNNVKKASSYLNKAYKLNKPVKVAKSMRTYLSNPLRTVYSISFPNSKKIKKNYQQFKKKIFRKRPIRKPVTKKIKKYVKRLQLRKYTPKRKTIVKRVKKASKVVKKHMNRAKNFIKKLKFW